MVQVYRSWEDSGVERKGTCGTLKELLYELVCVRRDERGMAHAQSVR